MAAGTDTQPLPLFLPSFPEKLRPFVTSAKRVLDVVRNDDGSVNRSLMSQLVPDVPANPAPVDGVYSSDHDVEPARGTWVRVFSPDGIHRRPLPVIVYFHGGGFAFFSPASEVYDTLCRRMAREVPAVVVSVEYRLAPEHRYPSAYDDGFDALRWMDGPAAAEVLPHVSAVFLSGDSAGGNIAHHVAQRAVAAAFGRVRIAGMALLEPYFGGVARTESEVKFGGLLPLQTELSDWLWQSFLPAGADRDHPAAKVFGPGSGGELAGLPPTAVFLGGCDPLRDRGMGYVEALREAGVEVGYVEYPRGIHAFYWLMELPETGQLISDIRDFVWTQLEKREAASGASQGVASHPIIYSTI